VGRSVAGRAWMNWIVYTEREQQIPWFGLLVLFF
jgi:hypothetical protein